jgi:SagB-type dehydrogenase family enzyme
MLSALLALAACAPPTIELVAPDLNRGTSYAKALSARHSDRNFKKTALPLQDLSDLLWSADGINRQSNSHLTIPTASNAQDISVYALLPDGAYIYDNKKHVLNGVSDGDHRAAAASTQSGVATAPVILLIVSDWSKFPSANSDPTEAKRLGALDAGHVSQTILLWASANGYGAVPRVIMQKDELAKVLGLKEKQVPELNIPVGLPA